MNMLNRFKAPLVLATVLAVPVLANCSAVEDAQGAVCCTEFKAGGTVSADIGGKAEAQVAVQAVADFSGIAAAAVDDITTACRNIATDLDVSRAAGDKAEQTADKQARMKAWCDLAVSSFGTFKATAKAKVDLVVVPPACNASVSAKANCQAKCSGSASCDLKANPPKCTGGKLEVSCKGTCTAEGSAELKCEGSCDGDCSGSCTAEGGVECNGTCEGTCEGNTANGSATGKCEGTCKGTCSATKPNVECTGSCQGSCKGTCGVAGSATVKCDGKCEGDIEPLKCEGGKLEGGCKADVKCDANCDASVSAKAECTPPSVSVEFTAEAGAAIDVNAAARIQATLEANLPLIFSFKARLEGMAKLTATITGNADVVADIKAACIPAVIATAVTAGTDVTASVSATGSLVAAIK